MHQAPRSLILASSLLLAATACAGSATKPQPSPPVVAAEPARSNAEAPTRPATVSDADLELANTYLELGVTLALQLHQAAGDCRVALAAIDETRSQLELLLPEMAAAFSTREEQLWTASAFAKQSDDAYAILSSAPCFKDPKVREALSCCFVPRAELEAQGYHAVEDQPAVMIK